MSLSCPDWCLWRKVEQTHSIKPARKGHTSWFRSLYLLNLGTFESSLKQSQRSKRQKRKTLYSYTCPPPCHPIILWRKMGLCVLFITVSVKGGKRLKTGALWSEKPVFFEHSSFFSVQTENMTCLSKQALFLCDEEKTPSMLLHSAGGRRWKSSAEGKTRRTFPGC